MKPINITGLRSGHLVAVRIDDIPEYGNKAMWICKCDCGNSKRIRADHIIYKETISCGCKHYVPKHGLCRTRLYGIWIAMKGRCNNKNNPHYARYGGRGISICQEWDKDFTAFYNWAIDNGYKDKYSIDRINNDGNYSPDNCRWATSQEQADNRAITKWVEIRGERMPLASAVKKYGLKHSTVYMRLRRGWTVERAFEGKI